MACLCLITPTFTEQGWGRASPCQEGAGLAIDELNYTMVLCPLLTA